MPLGRGSSEFFNCLTISPYTNKLCPIISIQISITKNDITKALIDSGADLSIIKLSACKPNISIDTNEKILLNGFTNNAVNTYGTCWADLILNRAKFTQKFQLVPDIVRMNNYDVILGKDFLINNRIIIDFGRGIVYSNPDAIQIIHNPYYPYNISMIGLGTQTPSRKTKIQTGNKPITNPTMSTPNTESNKKDSSQLNNSDIIYATEQCLIDTFIMDNFDTSIIEDLKLNGYSILLGCKNGKIFCTKEGKVDAKQPEIRNKLSSDINKLNIDFLHNTVVRNARISNNENTCATASKTLVNHRKNSIHNLNDRPADESFNLCTIEEYNMGTKIDQHVPEGRLNHANTSVEFFLNFCSHDINTCILNEDNIATCMVTLYDQLTDFVKRIQIGTTLNAIVTFLNNCNKVIVELKKFFKIHCMNTNDSNTQKYIDSIGKLTIDFKDVLKNNLSLGCILEYINILKKQIIHIAKAYKNIQLNDSDLLTEKEENNEIMNNILSIYAQKDTICIPARSEKIISVIFDSNEEQICLAKEIRHGVHVGNCIVKPVNNIGTISILNTLNTNVELKTINLIIAPMSQYEILKIESNGENESRINKLLERIDFKNLNNEELNSIKQILCDYNEIFYLEGDKLTHTDTVTHKIDIIPGSKPINCRPYRLPMTQRQEIDKQITKMLEEGIISPVNSAYNSPILVVPKKNTSDEKKYRVVIDYRKLNDISIGDCFPMPSITDILDTLGKCNYFTTLDLASGYHQIVVEPKDRHLTAFSTGTNNHSTANLGNQFEFNRLPFGLKNAPATFNRLMRTVMSGLQGIACWVFLDDIICMGHSLQEHNDRLRQVFDRLAQHNLKIQPDKCSFLRKEVTYLGHFITKDGIKPDPAKTMAVTNFPTPKTPKNIKSFLGLVGYYRRFIKNFAHIAKPLTSLLRKNIEFIWNSECNSAFEKLKMAITTEPVLQHPNFKEKFILTTDASNFAISGILSQGKIGVDLPIAFISRTLQPAETRYNTTEREMLAIFWSIKQFKTYLLGTEFIVQCDHKPLVYIFKTKDSYSRIFRWRLELSEYDFMIVYKPGKNNVNADALSRNIEDTKENENVYECNAVTRAAAKKSQNIENSKDKSVSPDSNSNEICETLEPIEKEAQTNANENRMNKLLNHKTFDNCLQYIQEFHHYGNEICELNITHKTKNENHFYLLSNKNFFELNIEHTKIAEHIYMKHENNIYVFYLTIKNDINNEIEYEEFFTIMSDLLKHLQILELRKICCIKAQNTFENLNYIKIKQILRYIFNKTNIYLVLYINDLINLTDKAEIITLIKETHNSLIGGHMGMRKTLARLKELYYWKNMKKEIKNYIHSCADCQKNKITRRIKMPMVITSTSKKPGERWAMDIVGPLDISSEGYRYVLTCQDDLTRYFLAIPLKDQESDTIARAFTEHVVLKFGCPETVLSDNGTNFVSNLMKRVFKLLQIKPKNTTVYRPQSNAALEKAHRSVKEYLRHYINKNLNDWNNYIPFFVFTYNTTPHMSTNFSPHELMFGEKATVPSNLTKKPDIVYNYDDYYFELRHKMQTAHEFARENLIKSKQHNKQYYDKYTNPHVFQIGDKVIMENPTHKKLEQRYTGPYVVLEIISDINTKIRVKNRDVVMHNNRLKPFFE